MYNQAEQPTTNYNPPATNQAEQPATVNKRLISVELPSFGRAISLEIASGRRYFDFLKKQRQLKLNVSRENKTDDEAYAEHENQCKIIAEFSDLQYQEAVDLLGPFEVLYLYLSIQGDLKALGELSQLMKK